MLAVSGRLPPAREDDAWSYELKWDGVRMLAHVAPSSVRLIGRSGIDATIKIPERFTEYADVSQADPADVAKIAAKLKGIL